MALACSANSLKCFLSLNEVYNNNKLSISFAFWKDSIANLYLKDDNAKSPNDFHLCSVFSSEAIVLAVVKSLIFKAISNFCSESGEICKASSKYS